MTQQLQSVQKDSALYIRVNVAASKILGGNVFGTGIFH